MKNTGGSNMSDVLKRSVIKKVDMDMTPEAEDAFYEAVCEYIYKFAIECMEMSKHTGRKTLAADDVEMVMKYVNI